MSDNKECFFIAPIGDNGSEIRKRSNKVMEYIVREAVSDYGYSVTRADQMDQPGSITSQVIQKTVDSELVIADLTGHNPNVFYELAVRHATGKPYIQLIKSTETIPFDISDLRTIQYGLEVDAADQAKEEIRGHLDSLEDKDTEFDNPISASAEMQSLRESEDPTDKNLAEILQTLYKLDNRMDKLEKRISTPVDDLESASIPEESKDLLDPEQYLIYRTIKKHENNNQDSISRKELISFAQDENMNKSTAKQNIKQLMMDGHIYETDDGTIKTIL
jgi:hypothetical protein